MYKTLETKKLTYSNKTYKIEIKETARPSHVSLYINGIYMANELPHIKYKHLIEYIRGYKKIME